MRGAPAGVDVWGVELGETILTLEGLGKRGGSFVFYQVGGCRTASRSETSGID